MAGRQPEALDGDYIHVLALGEVQDLPQDGRLRDEVPLELALPLSTILRAVEAVLLLDGEFLVEHAAVLEADRTDRAVELERQRLLHARAVSALAWTSVITSSFAVRRRWNSRGSVWLPGISCMSSACGLEYRDLRDQLLHMDAVAHAVAADERGHPRSVWRSGSSRISTRVSRESVRILLARRKPWQVLVWAPRRRRHAERRAAGLRQRYAGGRAALLKDEDALRDVSQRRVGGRAALLEGEEALHELGAAHTEGLGDHARLHHAREHGVVRAVELIHAPDLLVHPVEGLDHLLRQHFAVLVEDGGHGGSTHTVLEFAHHLLHAAELALHLGECVGHDLPLLRPVAVELREVRLHLGLDLVGLVSALLHRGHLRLDRGHPGGDLVVEDVGHGLQIEADLVAGGVELAPQLEAQLRVLSLILLRDLQLRGRVLHVLVQVVQGGADLREVEVVGLLLLLERREARLDRVAGRGAELVLDAPRRGVEGRRGRARHPARRRAGELARHRQGQALAADATVRAALPLEVLLGVHVGREGERVI